MNSEMPSVVKLCVESLSSIEKEYYSASASQASLKSTNAAPVTPTVATEVHEWSVGVGVTWQGVGWPPPCGVGDRHLGPFWAASKSVHRASELDLPQNRQR